MSQPPPAPSSASEHTFAVPVFIGDTDAYQMMYHSNYMKHFERARLEFFGLKEVTRLFKEEGLRLVELKAKHIRYFDSARLGEDCVAKTTLMEIDSHKATLNHFCERLSDSKCLTRMIVTIGFVDSSGTSAPWPPSVDLNPDEPRLAPFSGARIVGGAPKPFVRAATSPAPAAFPCSVYADMCDATGFMCHSTILDFFERARSAGLGGPEVLAKCKATDGVVFVVARMDNITYHVGTPESPPPQLGDSIEIRSVVELKYQGACIIFHQQLWRLAGGGKPEQLLVEGAISVYSIKEETKKPSPIPAWLNQQLTTHLIK